MLTQPDPDPPIAGAADPSSRRRDLDLGFLLAKRSIVLDVGVTLGLSAAHTTQVTGEIATLPKAPRDEDGRLGSRSGDRHLHRVDPDHVLIVTSGMGYAFHIVNVFTVDGDRLSGNPLCVFEDARGLDEVQMQRLARQMNLSETTFVLPADDVSATARVRIYVTGAVIELGRGELVM